MRETTVEMQASGVGHREVAADYRETRSDQRETRADQRETRADEREAEYSRPHPPPAERAVELGRESLDRALAQLRRAEDAVARARSHLARAEQDARLEHAPAGEQEDRPEPLGN